MNLIHGSKTRESLSSVFSIPYISVRANAARVTPAAIVQRSARNFFNTIGLTRPFPIDRRSNVQTAHRPRAFHFLQIWRIGSVSFSRWKTVRWKLVQYPASRQFAGCSRCFAIQRHFFHLAVARLALNLAIFANSKYSFQEQTIFDSAVEGEMKIFVDKFHLIARSVSIFPFLWLNKAKNTLSWKKSREKSKIESELFEDSSDEFFLFLIKIIYFIVKIV